MSRIDLARLLAWGPDPPNLKMIEISSDVGMIAFSFRVN
jgi:hypothetical protein